jgi:hypothetical protein
MYTFTEQNCGIFESCKNWILKTYPDFVYNTSQFIGSYTVNSGYNKIEKLVIYDSIRQLDVNYQYKKGSMIGIKFYSDIGLAEINANLNENDYFLNDTTNTLNRLNGRFYFSVLIDQTFFFNALSFNATIQNPEPQSYFEIKGNFIDSNQTFITQLPYFDINRKFKYI